MRRPDEYDLQKIVEMRLFLNQMFRHQEMKGDGSDDDVYPGVVTPLRGVAQVVLHGGQVVEVGVLLRVHQDTGVKEDGKGQVEVEKEEGEVKERRSWMACG